MPNIIINKLRILNVKQLIGWTKNYLYSACNLYMPCSTTAWIQSFKPQGGLFAGRLFTSYLPTGLFSGGAILQWAILWRAILQWTIL